MLRFREPFAGYLVTFAAVLSVPCARSGRGFPLAVRGSLYFRIVYAQRLFLHSTCICVRIHTHTYIYI